jgi:small subunit ribosomal protein S12
MAHKPQRKAVITKVYSTNPKKPNSANRKVCKVKLNNNNFMLCAIKGVPHNLKKFSKVWVQGIGFRDTPLIRSKLIVGKEAFQLSVQMSKRRSLYGVKRPS